MHVTYFSLWSLWRLCLPIHRSLHTGPEANHYFRRKIFRNMQHVPMEVIY